MQRTEETKVILKATAAELTKMFYQMIAKENGISIVGATHNPEDDVVTLTGRVGEPSVVVPIPLTIAHMIHGKNPDKGYSPQSMKGFTEKLKAILPAGYRIPMDKLMIEVKKDYPRASESQVRCYLTQNRKFQEVDKDVFLRKEV